MNNAAADYRNAARNGGPNSKPPIGILVKPQHLPGEGHSDCHQQEKYTDDPGELSGELICPEEEYLGHVNQHDRDHEIRAPAVDSAEKPAQLELVIQNIETAPGLP